MNISKFELTVPRNYKTATPILGWMLIKLETITYVFHEFLFY